MNGTLFLIAGMLMIILGIWGFIRHLKDDKVFRYYKRLLLLVVDVIAGLFFITLWA